jgi:PleD family two-component response regulator
MGGYVNRLRSGLAEANHRLEEALERISDIAIRDELTGTYNRRFLMESLAREQARAGRSRGGYAVCLMDLDHFKAVNDELGHAAGDEALRQVAAAAGRGCAASTSSAASAARNSCSSCRTPTSRGRAPSPSASAPPWRRDPASR